MGTQKTFIQNYIRSHTYLPLAGLAIILFLISILLANKVDNKQQPQEAIPVTDQDNYSIVVDVQGAVQKPGVYHLLGNSRVQDAILVAGGFDEASVNRQFVARQLNLAAKVNDGEKLYIPHTGENTNNIPQAALDSNNQTKVNINNAALEQLEGISGVSAASAAKIIASRPYSAVSDLLTKKVITKSVYNKIQDLLTAQ